MPHFGMTEQVSFSYFSYHLSVSIFGIVDVTRDKKYIYITDKMQGGSKNSDHTISYFYQYDTDKFNFYFMFL
jgi:hypothetical protein